MTQTRTDGKPDQVTVRRRGGDVVLTMTPRRAEIIAVSLSSNEFCHNDWLDTVADRIYAAAGPRPGPVTAGVGWTRGDPDPLRPPDARNLGLDEQAVLDLARALSYLQKDKNHIAATLETVAAEAAATAVAAVATASAEAGRAADQAGIDRATAVSQAAAAMIDTVRQAATVEQQQAESDAVLVAAAAAEAVRLAAQWSSHRDSDTEARYAAMIAGIVEASATATAERTRVRAATMAGVAAAAAVAAAALAADAAVRMDHTVSTTALAVRRVADRAEHLVAVKTTQAAAVVSGSW